jgi:hypothetical protein
MRYEIQARRNGENVWFDLDAVHLYSEALRAYRIALDAYSADRDWQGTVRLYDSKDRAEITRNEIER